MPLVTIDVIKGVFSPDQKVGGSSPFRRATFHFTEGQMKSGPSIARRAKPDTAYHSSNSPTRASCQLELNWYKVHNCTGT